MGIEMDRDVGSEKHQRPLGIQRGKRKEKLLYISFGCLFGGKHIPGVWLLESLKIDLFAGRSS